jgi:hypothetical protein
MTREQLEHLLRAAGDIADDDEIIVVGSQAILGQFPDAPAALRVSVEADMFPKNRPERADLIDGTIGELSPFHETFGYYAQGVAEETSVLPSGWRQRLIRISNQNTRGVTGLCLEIHDLAIAKAMANREKDREFVAEVIRHGLVNRDVLVQRLEQTPASPEQRQRIRTRLESEFARRE